MKFRKITKVDLQELNQNQLTRLEKIIKSKEELTSFEKEKYLKLLDYTLSQALIKGSFYDSKNYLVLNLDIEEYKLILGLKNHQQIQILMAHFISKNLIEYRIWSTEVIKDYTMVIPNLYLLIPDIFHSNEIIYEMPEEKIFFG